MDINTPLDLDIVSALRFVERKDLEIHEGGELHDASRILASAYRSDFQKLLEAQEDIRLFLCGELGREEMAEGMALRQADLAARRDKCL